MGISAFDAEGNFKGITPVLQEVNNAFANMTEEQKTNYASMIAGKTQITGFRALLGGLSQEYDSLYNAQNNATGALEKMYGVMQDNTKGKIDSFLSKLESFGLQLADVLLPHINNLLDSGMKFVDFLKTIDSATLDTIVQIVGLTAGFGGLLKVFGSVTTSLGSMASFGGGILKWASEMEKKAVPALKGFGGGIKDIISKYEDLRNQLYRTDSVLNKTKEQLNIDFSKNIISMDEYQNGLYKCRQEEERLYEQLSQQKAEYAKAAQAINDYRFMLGGTIAVVALVGASIYATSQYLDAMNNNCLVAKEDMSLLEQAFTKLNGGTVRTRKELEELGLVEKELSDSFSDEFKKAVLEAEKDVENFGFTLNSINADGIITKEEVSALSERVNNLCDDAISALQSREQEIQDSLQTTFGTDGIIDQDEQRIIDFYANQKEANIKEVTDMQDEVNEILRKVRDEGYKMTPEDEQKIKNYYMKLKQIELEAQADKSEELEYAKNDFQNRAKNIDAKHASELLKQKNKELDEMRIQEMNSIDQQIYHLKKGYDDMDEQDKAYVDKKVKTLEEQKFQVGEKYKQMYNENYNYLIENNKNLKGEIDRFSGELMDERNKGYNRQLEDMKKHYVGLNTITQDGTYKMYNTEKEMWTNVQVDVDEKTGEIVSAVSWMDAKHERSFLDMAGYNSEYIKSAENLKKESVANYNKMAMAIKDVKGTTINANGEIVNSNGKVVGSLSDIKQGAKGVKEGIVDLNGTPVKVKFDDKTGVIRNAKEIEDAINKIPTTKTFELNVVTKGNATYLQDNRGNYFRAYATGTSNAPEGVAQVNEAGYELIDSVTLSARALAGTMAYLPSGTKVTNHLMTTLKMKADIKKEVAKAMAGIDNGSVVNEIVVNSGDIVVNGNLDNVTLDDLDKVIAKNNAKLKDNIYSELNKVAKKY